MIVEKKRKRFKKKLQNISLVIMSLSITVVILEIAIRIFIPQELRFNVTQWDSYVGFVNIPNIQGYAKNQDYRMFVNINSRGLRDKFYEYKKASDSIRIGIFGDSFTFGEGVQNDETYPNCLEKIFDNDKSTILANKKIEIINFGISKTGTSHQLAFYKKEGVKYDLDFILLGFFAANDFDDNWGGVFYLEDGELKHKPASHSPVRKIQMGLYSTVFYRWTSTHSHFVNLLRIAATKYYDKRRLDDGTKYNSKFRPKKDSSIIDNKVDLTERLLVKFKRDSESRNVRFIVINLPFKGQKILSEYNGEEKIPNFVKMNYLLWKNVEKKDIEMLDLIPVFSKFPYESYYFKHDLHMNKLGHQLIASELFEYLLPILLARFSNARTYQ